jgi:hypothetical protein
MVKDILWFITIMHGISRVSKLSNIPVQLSEKKNTTYVGK